MSPKVKELSGYSVTEEERPGNGIRWKVAGLPAPYFWPGPGGSLFLITAGGRQMPADSEQHPDLRAARGALARLLAGRKK